MTNQTQPKSSALFNNCLLHSITPEIKAEILKLAADPLYNNKHNEAYNQLKDSFAEFYQLDNSSLDWQLFGEVLKSYNPFDTQILLGPVLRMFAGKMMSSELNAAEQYDNTHFYAEATEYSFDLSQLFQDIKSTGEDNDSQKNYSIAIQKRYISIQSTVDENSARYTSLSPVPVFNHVCKPLGLGLVYSQNNIVNQMGNEPTQLGTAWIYHKGDPEGARNGGHWERSDDDSMIEDFAHHGSTQLEFFLSFFQAHQSLQTFNAAFSLIRQHVQLTQQSIAKNAGLIDEFTELNYTALQIEHYLFNIQSVSKDVAIELLGKPLTDKARAFIDTYKFQPLYDSAHIQNYIAAVKKRSIYIPHLNEVNMKIAERLLFQPPHMHEAKPSSIRNFTKIIVPFSRPNTSDSESRNNTLLAKQQAEEQLAKLEAALLAENPFKLQFDKQIEILEAKKEEFKDVTEYPALYNKLNQLCINLKKEGAIYFGNKPTDATYEVFVEHTNELIDDAHAAINQHRNFTLIVLANIAAFICSAALGYLIAAGVDIAMHKGKFTFFNTQRADEVNKLQDIIQHSNPRP